MKIKSRRLKRSQTISFLNAGIYVIDAEFIDLVPSNEYFDMTSLFEQIIFDQIELQPFNP